MCGFFSRQLFLSLTGLRDLFFPRRCRVCGHPLETGEEDVCRECFDDLPLTYQWETVQNAAFERLAARFEPQAAAALFFFRAGSDYRKIIYAVKYGGRRRLGYRMGFMLGERLATNREFLRCQAVVPVPLHPLRLWKRGYNQAEDIALGIAGAMGLPLETGLLRRRRHTRTQTGLKGIAKAKNVEGAFRIDAERAAELRTEGTGELLLVDDVLTTGSTLAASAAPLTAAGFRVSCAILAFTS